MAAITFPTSPTVNQIFTSGVRSWIWTGTVSAVNTTHTQPASTVIVTPSGGISSTTVAAALAELDTKKVPNTGDSTIAGNKTFSGNVSVQGNANLGDAAGDAHVIRGTITAQDATAASGSSVMTRDLVDLRPVTNPVRYRDLTALITALGTGAGIVGGTASISDGRVGGYFSVGIANATSRITCRIARSGPLNGSGGNAGIDFDRNFWMCVSGEIAVRTGVDGYLIIGAGVNDVTLPAAGPYMGLHFQSSTSVRSVTCVAAGSPVYGSPVTVASVENSMCVWINNKGGGAGDIYVLPRAFASAAQFALPASPTCSWTGGPTGVSNGQTNTILTIASNSASPAYSAVGLYSATLIQP